MPHLPCYGLTIVRREQGDIRQSADGLWIYGEPAHNRDCRSRRTCLLGLQSGPIVNILEPQGIGEQALLQGALDRAFDIFPHGAETDGVWVVPQDCGLLLKVFPREVQVRRLRSPGAFISDFFGALEGIV